MNNSDDVKVYFRGERPIIVSRSRLAISMRAESHIAEVCRRRPGETPTESNWSSGDVEAVKSAIKASSKIKDIPI